MPPSTVSPIAKLTVKQVRSIRKEVASGRATQIEMAQKYKVSAPTISYIINGKKYQGVV